MLPLPLPLPRTRTLALTLSLSLTLTLTLPRWASQYTARLMRPAPRLGPLLDAALAESGLGAALAAGPVAGFHVRQPSRRAPAAAAPRARPACSTRVLDAAAMLRGCGYAGGMLAGYPPSPPLQVRHGDSCIASEAARTARRCEPLSRYSSNCTWGGAVAR